MSEIVDQSLQKIAKGAGIIFVGTALGMLLAFISRIVLVRYVTQHEYGLYSLALVLLSISILISTLGLEAGAARQAAFYRGKDDIQKVKGVVLSSLQISIIASLSISLVLFFASDFISTRFFHSPELSMPVKIFCIAIPFSVLINILISIFRGFDKAQPSLYFQHISKNALFLLFLIMVTLLGLPFMGVVYAFVASIALTFIAFAVYATKKSPLALRGESSASVIPAGKELLLFSLPLLAVIMLNQITAWTDTLMIGYFLMPDDVGLYNVALPLVHLLPIVLNSVAFLYFPIMLGLYAKDQMEEIKKTYAVLTKWIFSVTLPILFIFVLFPEATLDILFGSRYIAAAFALQILALGFFIHAVFGPNSTTLIVMGKTRFLMWSVLMTTILNIILNIVLIPPFGIIGAALATASALAMKNLFWTARLYSLSKIHPFTKNYLKPPIVSIGLALIIYVVVRNVFSVVPFWLLPALFILFVGVCALSIVVTKSFDKQDIMMLLAIEQRLGVNLTIVKRILGRFT